MSAFIRPNRTEVSRAFPVLGFTVRTGFSPAWIEWAVASTWELLFSPEAKANRSHSNFYSSRAQGPLPVERGEAICLVPPAVMARFAGQDKLFYALAVYRQPDFRNPEVVRVPPEAAPAVVISKSFTGNLRSLTGLPNPAGGLAGNGYAGDNRAALEWGGDMAQPGELRRVAVAGNGAGAAEPPPQPAAAQAGLAVAYSDGFDDAFWARVQEAEDVEAYGIEGPIPDTGAYSQEQRYSRALSAPEYPRASRFVPAAAANYRASGSRRTINRIVIHITDGGANIAGPISWFQNPAARVSAHYIIGQDGEIVQMVHHNDVAWHARRANGDSIGIEHVANTRGLLPTEAQYCSSATLVRWLSEQYGIPMDRQHIVGHAEVDTGTSHAGCPNAVWNWDYFMGMVTGGSCYPMPSTTAQALTQRGTIAQGASSYGAPARPFTGASFDVHWSDVQLVPQLTTMSCWAAAAAMIVGWRDRVSIDPAAIAAGAGHWADYDLNRGLNPADSRDLAAAWRLRLEPPQDYTIDGLRHLLQANGPLWVGVAMPGGHAVAVTGIFGDGTADGTFVRVNDPWPPGQGSQYERGLRQFMQEYDDQMTLDSTGTVNIQILHAGGRNGVSTAQRYNGAHNGHARTLAHVPAPSDAARGMQPHGHNGHAGSRNGATQTALPASTLSAPAPAGSRPTYAAGFAFVPVAGDAVERMRAEFVANASAGSPRNCITITNAGLRRFYGASLQEADGSARPLGSTIQDTMAHLQTYGLAQAATVFEFNDAAGRLTRGVNRPETLRTSVEQWLLAEAEQNAQSAWYVFGLSLMDGYHSVVLALAFSGTNNPDTKVYWADQIYNGWDDVTGRLDQRIASLIQRWWDPLPADRKARTRVTVWPLHPGAPAANQGYSLGLARSRALNDEETEGIDADEDDLAVYGQALTGGECTDEFCPVSQATTAGTQHFALAEFHCRDGTEVPERFRGNVQAVMENLEVLRAELGGAAITVNSAYRTCSYNARVGGEDRSRHLCGQAADITVAGYTPEEVHTTIERLIDEGRMRQGGLGLYPGRFVHYDVRGRRARWTGRGRAGKGNHSSAQ